MGTLFRQMTLKDRYWFGGFSGTPPSEPNLSTPPPPPRAWVSALVMCMRAHTSHVIIFCAPSK